LLADAVGLPESVRLNPKTGFDLPFAHCFRTIWRERMEKGLARLGRRGMLDPAGIARVRHQFLQPNGEGWWSRVWMLLVVDEWMERIGSNG